MKGGGDEMERFKTFSVSSCMFSPNISKIESPEVQVSLGEQNGRDVIRDFTLIASRFSGTIPAFLNPLMMVLGAHVFQAWPINLGKSFLATYLLSAKKNLWATVSYASFNGLNTPII